MAEVIRKVRPTATDEYLDNPHKGCCTFQHFNGDPLFPGERWSESGPLEFPDLPIPAHAGDMPTSQMVIDGYLPTTVAYCRWFWNVMEPREGQYDFSMIEKSLETCAKRGQTLAVRLMSFGSRTEPIVPDWYSAKYPMEVPKTGHGEARHPVHDSKEYLEKWGGFIREAGRRFDGHPLMESIDITYIGPWGEGAGTCGASQCREFAALWKEAWPTVPRLALVGGDQMREGVLSGSGWRCDCFGDLSAKGSDEVAKHLSFNHHFDAYPREVYNAGAKDAWMHGPVHFEACGVPMSWYRLGFDLDFIMQQGLKFHGTYLMPKYTRLPTAWMEKLSTFCRQLGYRFVLRYALFDLHVPVGGSFRFQSWIENTGVAPIYHKYDFAIRLRQGQRTAILPLKDVDIRTWMPGDTWLDARLQVPANFERGYVEVSAGLINKAKQAKVNFAVKERYADRWTPLDGFYLE